MATKTEDTLSELLGQINEAATKGLLGGAQQDLKKLNRYKGTFTSLINAVNSAYEAGFEGQAASLQDVQLKLNASIRDYSGKIGKCMTRLRENLTDAERKAAEDRLKSLKGELAERLKTQTKLVKREVASNAKIIEDYKTKRLNLKKDLQDQFFEMKLGGSVESAFNNLTGALTDGGQTIGKGITGALAGASKLFASRQATQAFRSKQVEDPAQKAMLEKSAKSFGSLSKSMLVLGASVGAVFAIVKAFQAIEESGKKINKSLIDNIGATDLMADSSGNLYDEVNKVRRAITKADFALSLGLSAEEAQSLVKELNDANFSIASLGDNTEEAMSNLHRLMMTVREGSVALGVSTSEMVSYAERFRMEMGMSAREADFASRISEDFKSIRDLAMQSGYSTSKFFDKIKTLTEGIGKFNVRTEQAGKILLSLTKVIGPQAAEDFTKGLIGAFRQEGYTDRLKRLKTTPQAQVSKALEASAKAQAGEFSRNFLKSGGAKDIFAQYNLSGDNLIKGTRRMSEKDIQSLLGELQGAGQTGAARSFYELMDAVRSKGRMGQVRQLGQADAGATLRIKASQFSGVMGGKSIREAGLGKLKMLEALGFSPEEVEQYAKIVELKKAELGMLKKKQSLTKEEQIQYGVKMQGGQLVNVETGEVVENVEAYLQAQGARLEDEFGDLKAPTLEQIMQDNIRATQTSSEKLGAHLGEIMQGVYDVTMGIYDKIFGEGQSEKARATQQTLIEETLATVKGYTEAQIRNNDKIRELEAKKASVKDPAQAQALNDQISTLKKQNEQMQGNAALAKATLGTLRQKKFTSESAGDMRAEAFSEGAIRLARSGAKGKTALASSGAYRQVHGEQRLNAEMEAKRLGFASVSAMLDSGSFVRGSGPGTGKMEYSEEVMRALKGLGLSVAGQTYDASKQGYRSEVGGKSYSGPVLVDSKGNAIAGGSKTMVEAGGRDMREAVSKRSLLERAKQRSEGGGLKMVKAFEDGLTVLPINPMDPQVQKGRKKDAKAQAEEMAKNSDMKKAREEGVYKGMKKAQEENYKSRIMGLASELGIDTEGTLKQVSTRFAGARESLAADNPDLVSRLAETIAIAKEAGFIDDGFIMKNGRATRISDQDNVLAFKDGGPADPRRGRATASININIMGGKSDTLPQFERAVERVLRRTGVVVEPGNRTV